ncbi:MAG: hypothetical protein JXP34_19230 [Planctomycetes bacterium]|nr:hypothetical protein [Planctomycetota bacterium]
MSVVVLLIGAAAISAGPSYPPALPDGKRVATDTNPAFLAAPAKLRPGVAIAESPPTIDFLYYPGQDYEGNPWSVWGDGLAVSGTYYSSIGDHKAPGGNAFVHEYDSRTKELRAIVDLRELLDLPEGHYTPGKIHSRIDRGRDGWLYFSTHRGSTRVTTDRYHYAGDWIIRHHPETGRTEIVAHAPVPRQCIPASVLDPERLVFYGGTAAGDYDDKRIMFFAYDIRAKRLLHSCYDGPARYMIFARSTGKLYFAPGLAGRLHVFDPAKAGAPVPLDGTIGLRSATQETPQGFVYTVSTSPDATLWSFDTKTETIRELGSAAVGSQTYITSLDASPDGRYLYYIPGAHGGSQEDGTPVVQYDVKTGKKKVLAFLHPFYRDTYGYTPLGTFGSAVDPKGDKLYITWNGNRGGPDARGRLAFDTCALTVIHIPESERMQ